jgi:hypothetical protein
MGINEKIANLEAKNQMQDSFRSAIENSIHNQTFDPHFLLTAGRISLCIIMIFVAVFACYWMIEENKKWNQRQKERLRYWQKKSSDHKFIMCFGFDPIHIKEVTYRKEILIKLSMLASKLEEYTQKIAANNVFWYRMQYSEFFARYQECIEVLEKHSPGFTANFPHWTKMQSFAESLNRQGK